MKTHACSPIQPYFLVNIINCVGPYLLSQFLPPKNTSTWTLGVSPTTASGNRAQEKRGYFDSAFKSVEYRASLQRRLVVLGMSSVAGGVDDFLDAAVFGGYKLNRMGWWNLLDGIRYVDLPDTLLRLAGQLRPSKLRATHDLELIHELVDVFLAHDGCKGSRSVATAYQALAFAGQPIFVVFRYLFDFFQGQWVHGWVSVPPLRLGDELCLE